MSYYLINNNLFDDSAFASGEYVQQRELSGALKCEVCGSYLSMRRWLPPYEVQVTTDILGDFIFGEFSNFIVSARFRTLFEAAELKGVENFNPVRIKLSNGIIENQYFYPEIVMSGVRTDIVQSNLMFEGDSECIACQKHGRVIKGMKGLIFENPETIESDIFNIKMIANLIVSSDFKRMVEENELSNLSLQPIESYVPPWILADSR